MPRLPEVSVLRLPILWMFLGPPAIRIASERDGMSSVQGDQDIWNIIRLVWWLGWGAVAVLDLARASPWVRDYVNRLGSLPAWIGLWLMAVILSTTVSPSPMFTLANASMLAVLVVAALDLGVKVYAGRITIGRVLHGLMVWSAVLLVLVGVVYVLSPERVGLSGHTAAGVRIRGGGIAYTPIMAQILVFVGLCQWQLARGPRNGDHVFRRGPQILGKAPGALRHGPRLAKNGAYIPLMFVALGVLWLYLAKTRAAYLGCTIGLAVFGWHVVRPSTRMMSATLTACLAISVACTLGFLYDASFSMRWELDRAYERWILRDEFAIDNPALARASLASLNGRTEVQSVLLREIVTRPLGLGYIAGVRTFLDRQREAGELSVALRGAHNTYIETWAGSGYAALVGYLGMILFVIWCATRLRTGGAVTLAMRVLLLVVLFEGMFENEMAFPFHQSPVLFWVMAALITAHYAAEHRAGLQRPARVRRTARRGRGRLQGASV